MDIEKYECMKITVHMWLFHDFFFFSVILQLWFSLWYAGSIYKHLRWRNELLPEHILIYSECTSIEVFRKFKGQVLMRNIWNFLYKKQCYTFFFLLNQVVLHSCSLNKTDHKYSLKFWLGKMPWGILFTPMCIYHIMHLHRR